MGKYLDLTGYVFERLTVVEDVGRNSYGGVMWKCRCQCGNYTTVRGYDLRKGAVKSCGCLLSERSRERKLVHGMYGRDLYWTWASMKRRCNCPTDKRYKYYGQRGIKVCKEWNDEFIKFYEWATSNGWKKGLTIDRIDNTKGYSPDNCRWITMKEQMNNMTSNRMIEYDGRVQNMAQWAEECGIKYGALQQRLDKLHWSTERAL